jgi:acyl-CoA synthetase (AMP-forming)/AMP-acid ligase II
VYNSGKKAITLFYESDRELEPAFLRERLSVCLPKYMLPTVLHWMECLPRNPNGKIDRAKLVAAVGEGP